ncbi:MAG TPA: type II toxin-antitoxin system MqsA family antitoxin [Thermoflexia bacterium]|nr:type II toxin-antitoxin system MqsA family antitoxin [Thermoflexia bacterium]
MSERNMGNEILEGVREIKAHKTGQLELRTRELSKPSTSREIRERLDLSQSAFAGLMGVNLRMVQEWERGKRKPCGPARSLLRIAEQHPEVFVKAV